MSWTQPSVSSSLYRFINFQGARILEDFELNDLQNILTTKSDNSFSGVFSEGGLVNALFTVSGLTVSLAAKDGTRPILAFFNGALEPVAPFSYTFPSPLTGTTFIYLNWVLWRVTADGTHGGVSGCLIDPTLSDSISGEPTAERGQLQIVLSTDTTLALSAIDTTLMVAKITTPLPIYTLTWSGSSITGSQPTTVNPDLLANSINSGFVKLTTDTSSGTAASSDDARMSDARNPLPGSVWDSAVSNLNPIGGASTSIATQEYWIGSSGIGSAKIVYETIGAKLKDYLDWVNTQILNVLALVASFGARLSALEGAKPVTTDLSWHVGQPLGIPGDHGTHPPTYTSITDGFVMFGDGGETVSAYAVKSEGNFMSNITQDGNYTITNPVLTAGLPSKLTSLAGLMDYVNTLGASSGSTLIGDVNGIASANSVTKVRGIPVTGTRADGTTPQSGDVLALISGALQFGSGGEGGGGGFDITSIGGEVTGSGDALMSWMYFTLGSHRFGIGFGNIPNSEAFSFPANWNPAWTVASAAISVMPPIVNPSWVQVLPPSQGTGWTTNFSINSSPVSSDSGFWAAVTVFSVSST